MITNNSTRRQSASSRNQAWELMRVEKREFEYESFLNFHVLAMVKREQELHES